MPGRDDSLHDGSRTFIPNHGTPLVTSQTILDAFVRKLADLNRRNLLAGATTDVQNTDPRDIAVHAHALAEGLVIGGTVPAMEKVAELGAQVLALALAVARHEDQRPELGDAA